MPFLSIADFMKQYHDLLHHVLENGISKSDRTGTGTLSVFGHQMRFDLQRGFPCLTTKRLRLRSIIHELLWFLMGETNIRYLKENGVSIWDEWADRDGNLGPVYGYQWRSWPAPDGKGIDQIAQLVEQIQRNPDSRRLIVSAWWTAWRCRPATACFSSMWRREDSPVSSTNAVPTFFLGCPSISPPIPYSR